MEATQVFFGILTPKHWGRWSHFDEHMFQRGWKKPPTSYLITQLVVYTTYIPLIVIAFWGGYMLPSPPFRGTRNHHWVIAIWVVEVILLTSRSCCEVDTFNPNKPNTTTYSCYIVVISYNSTTIGICVNFICAPKRSSVKTKFFFSALRWRRSEFGEGRSEKN